MQTNRLLNLDGLRLVCALAVVYFHMVFRGPYDQFYAQLYATNWLNEIGRYGQIGVHIFFCISGFVVAYSAKGRTPMDFAISRFSRLYPTFIFCLTITFCVRMIWGGETFATSFSEYFANFIMVPQASGKDFMDGVYWSLVIEVVFYGWVFVLMLLGIMWRFQTIIMAVWLAIALVNELHLNNNSVRFLLTTQFTAFFVIGMIVQRCMAEAKISAPSAGLFAVALLLGLSMVQRHVGDGDKTVINVVSDVGGIGVFLGGLALFIAAAVVKRPVMNAVVLAWAGGISYALYLLHEIIGWLILRSVLPVLGGPLALLLVVFATLALASAVWIIYDRPVVPFTRKFLRRLL
jgi:peptidoglycan/LPS O-acetylase OafA/YrhL